MVQDRMGAALTYTAVRDGDPDRICASLKLEGTGQFEWFLDATFAGIVLPPNWYVLVANRSLRYYHDSIFSRLSADTTVLSCFLEEHVMYSTFSAWKNGAEQWSVTHDCNYGLAHLERTGEVPPDILAIAEERIAEQKSAGGDKADVDHVFDVPVAAMAHYTGFRHDRVSPETDGKFETLRPVRGGVIERVKSALRRKAAE